MRIGSDGTARPQVASAQSWIELSGIVFYAG